VTELRDDLYRILKEGRVPFSGLAMHDGTVEVRIVEQKDRDRVTSKLASAKDTNPSHAVSIADGGDGLMKLAPTDAAFAQRLHELVGDSVDMIEQRLRDTGVKLAAVLPDGPDRIRVVLPGVKDPAPVIALFNKRVQVSIRLVDVSLSPEDALRGSPPAGSEILYGYKDKAPYLVRKESALVGDDISSAFPGFESGTGRPVAYFRFNARGTRRLAHVTAENVGKPFAIVLDEQVFSAPVIREPITGGSGQISGEFTTEEVNTIAMMLRAGSLPGRLSVVEQQVLEPLGGKP